MNKRLIFIGVPSALLLCGSLASMVVSFHMFISEGESATAAIAVLVPAVFGLLTSLYVLTDIFPIVVRQQYRANRRIDSIKMAFVQSLDGGHRKGTLEKLLAEPPDIPAFHSFLKEIDRPLRSYNFDCLDATTLKDLEVAIISSLSRVIQLLQTSKDPHAHLGDYLEDVAREGKELKEVAYRRHIGYSVEESLAHCVIFMLKALRKCGIPPYVTRWPIDVNTHEAGNLQDSIKGVLVWIASPGKNPSRERLSEIYLLALCDIVEMCRANDIPISFYVEETLKFGQ